jgi:hypothetical protein
VSDWRETAKGGDWRKRAMSSGGAEGGPSSDEPLNAEADIPVAPPPKTPAEMQRDAEEAQYQKNVDANSLTRGQWLQDLARRDPDAARKFVNRRDTGAAAELLSVARGASGPFGAHLDEMAGAVKSGHISGPEYEREKRLAQQTLDAATGHAPAGPIIGAMMLPQPSSALGRVALNTANGASEGFGDAQTLDKAPTEAMKRAAVAAVLSVLGEGISKGARSSGENITDRTTASRQALKAAGLRGGISSQLAKRGLDDADALELGRNMLDENLIPFGGSKASVRDRAAHLRDMAGNSYGAQLAKGDAMGSLDYNELGNAMLGPYNAADAVKQSAGKQALDLVDQFEAQGAKTPGSFVGAGRAKASAWDSANFSDTAKNAPRLYRETMGAGAQNITEQLARIDPAAAEALQTAAKKYGVGSEAYSLAKEAAQRELENNTLGMTELLSGIGGAAAGAPSGNMLTSGAAGLGTAVLGGVAKRRGNAAAAVLLDKLSPAGGAVSALGDAVQRAEPALVEEERPGGMLNEYMRLLNNKDDEHVR